MNYRTSQAAIVSCVIALLCSVGSRAARGEEMQYPLAAAVAGDGTIFVADTNAPAIWRVKDGKVEKYFEASKKFRTPLNRPRCLAVDQDGKLLAGDSSTREVYRFDEGGKPVPLTKGGIGIPRSIAVLPSGEMMVSDQELHCIWKVPAAGGDPVKFVDVPGIIALCVDKDGDLWVTSGPKYALRRVSPDGKIENVIAESSIQFPQDVTVDEAKNVFIADNYSKAIWKVVPGQAPAKLVEGEPLVNPVGVTRSGDMLIVTDPRAKAVFQVDAAGKISKITP